MFLQSGLCKLHARCPSESVTCRTTSHSEPCRAVKAPLWSDGPQATEVYYSMHLTADGLGAGFLPLVAHA